MPLFSFSVCVYVVLHRFWKKILAYLALACLSYNVLVQCSGVIHHYFFYTQTS